MHDFIGCRLAGRATGCGPRRLQAAGSGDRWLQQAAGVPEDPCAGVPEEPAGRRRPQARGSSCTLARGRLNGRYRPPPRLHERLGRRRRRPGHTGWERGRAAAGDVTTTKRGRRARRAGPRKAASSAPTHTTLSTRGPGPAAAAAAAAGVAGGR